MGFLQDRINQTNFRLDGYTEHNAKVICKLQTLVNENDANSIANFRTIANSLKKVSEPAIYEMIERKFKSL